MLAGCWLVVLPSLLFGTLVVLAPLRLAAARFRRGRDRRDILCSAAVEAVNNIVLGRLSDRIGPLRPLLAGLGASAVVALRSSRGPTATLVLAVLVVLRRHRVRHALHARR